MNDRFKFRIWEKDQKIMKECTQITLDKEQTGSMCDVKGKVTAHLIYQPHYILMQCTGLKDKNGKLIYEGDIVTYICDSDYCSDGYHKCLYCCYGEKAEIIFDDSSAMFKYSSIRDECSLDDNIDTEINLEVIGNIYENKELLDERN